MQAAYKQNFFPTLNEALDSEGLVDFWVLGSNINYGETVQHLVDMGDHIHLISVYRDDKGRYERPVHYSTGRKFRK